MVANLPIDVVSDSPLRFKWRQDLCTVVGQYKISHEGALPSSVEEAVAELVRMAKAQSVEIEDLRRINQDVAMRVAAQSDLLSKKSESVQSSRARK